MSARRPRWVSALAGLGLVAAGLVATVATATPAQAVVEKAFPGSGFGAVPDGLAADCSAPGAPLEVSFAVGGLSGPPVTVAVTGLTGTHGWVGDLTARLVAPNGTSHVLFARAGSNVPGGDDSDFAGPYTFADSGDRAWWPAAAAVSGTSPIVAGAYRTSAPASGTTTAMNAVFADVPDANGTWRLQVTDACAGEPGEVTAATLAIEVSSCGALEKAVETAEKAVAAAQGAVGTAQAALASAQSATGQAAGAAAVAGAAATAADAALAKAKAKLAKAKKTGSAAKVKRARAKVRKARAAATSASATLGGAQAAQTTAAAASASAQATLAAAQAALTTAQAELKAAQAEYFNQCLK